MLKARFFSEGKDIIQLTAHSLHTMIVHPQNIAFSAMKDNKVFSYFCEHSFTEREGHLISAYSESFRTQQYYIYALNSLHELVVYDANLASKSEESGCKMIAKLKLPEEFIGNGEVGMASMRGALLMQAEDGRLMILDTSLGSLLQTAEFNIFNPQYMDEAKEKEALVQTPIKV